MKANLWEVPSELAFGDSGGEDDESPHPSRSKGGGEVRGEGYAMAHYCAAGRREGCSHLRPPPSSPVIGVLGLLGFCCPRS